MWSRGTVLRSSLNLVLQSGLRLSLAAGDVGGCASIRNRLPSLQIISALGCGCRGYVRSPIERLTMEQLKGAVSGGRGGRGGRGRKRGGKKGMRDTQAIWIGRGTQGERWPGLSAPMGDTRYSLDWLQSGQLDMKKVEVREGSGVGKAAESEQRDEEKRQFMVRLRQIEGKKREERRLSEMDWDRVGWSGRMWGGRYVGCPESPNGTPLEDFRSVVIEMKKVANQTKGGKKRTISALVVVGNGNGMAGFAVGRGEELRAAIRKAKNKAVNYLHFIPRCDNHTIYHDVKVKYCKTNIEMERRVKGTGLRCHRSLAAICRLAGISDMRAKVTGSNNPLNTVRAAFKGLTSQETLQDLANRTGQFVVEYRQECLNRPVVVAMPTGQEEMWEELRQLQLLPKSTVSSVAAA